MKPRVEKNPGAKSKSRATYPDRGTRPSKTKGEMSVSESVAEISRSGESARKAQPPTSHPTKEEISARAFAIWESEGKPAGNDIEHWLRAEAELRLEKSLGK